VCSEASAVMGAVVANFFFNLKRHVKRSLFSLILLLIIKPLVDPKSPALKNSLTIEEVKLHYQTISSLLV
jgi:hypothetical protein